MDINILMRLQEFRNGVGSCLVDFMSKMSFIGEMNTVLIIMVLVYWCVNKAFTELTKPDGYAIMKVSVRLTI